MTFWDLYAKQKKKGIAKFGDVLNNTAAGKPQRLKHHKYKEMEHKIDGYRNRKKKAG